MPAVVMPVDLRQTADTGIGAATPAGSGAAGAACEPLDAVVNTNSAIDRKRYSNHALLRRREPLSRSG